MDAPNLWSVLFGCCCDLAADQAALRRFPCGETRKGSVPSENLIRWIRRRKENRLMIETDGDLLQTFARIYVGLLSFA
jgi:hypothetical protein